MDAFQNGGPASGVENSVLFQHMDKSRSNEGARQHAPNGGGDSHSFSKDDTTGNFQSQGYHCPPFNKGYGFDTQPQTTDQHSNAGPTEYGGQQNNQYGMYPDQNFDSGYGPQGLQNGPQKPGSVGVSQMNMRPLSNYGPDMQRIIPNSQNQLAQQNASTPTLNELLQSTGPSPKYPGHNVQGEYSMGQFRPEGPVPPHDVYNNQSYWSSQIRGYPPAQNSAYRHQVSLRVLNQS